ncbi:MAG: ABC transporter ATP-binding protein [Candidatus Omnitrophota bacterium]|jgi:subfamily B ATP-binding cassette protein MsbA
MTKSIKFLQNIRKIRDFAAKTDIKIRHFIIPSMLSFSAAILEGAGIALLIPLAKGVLQMDFDFIQETKAMQFIMYKIFHVYSRPHVFIFAFLVSAILGSMIMSNVIRYFATIATMYHLRKFSDRLRRIIFNRYLTFGKLFFDRHNLGYLHNIIVNFVNQIASEFYNLQNAFTRFFTLIVYLIIMFTIEARLTVLVILLLPFLQRLSHRIIEKIKKSSSIYASFSKKINEQIFNILSCFPLVKIYAREEREKEEFNILSNNLRIAEFSIDRKSQLIRPINEIIIFIIIMLLISIMTFMVTKEKTGQVSSFLVFFYLLKRASSSLYFLTMIKNSLATISGPVSEIKKIFDDEGKFFVVDGEREFTGLKNGIELRNLTFSYVDNVQVLKNFSFVIEKNKMTALVGPSGAGKTTLINLILRFYECLPSSIYIDGIDMRNFSLASLRKHMALVSQDALLFNDTIKKNITYGLDRVIDESELVEIAKKARLYDFILKLPNRFNTYIGDRGVKLSGGEKQRVAIARALLKNAELLILDEATSSLDSKTEKLIQEAISEAARGKTTIVIAHRLSTIKNADKIVVMESGSFIEGGTLNELLAKKGKFYEYWQEQKFY